MKVFPKLIRLLGIICVVVIIALNLGTSTRRLLDRGNDLTKKDSFVLKRVERFKANGSMICPVGVFTRYQNFHSVSKKLDKTKYLIYHILESDIVGLGCRITSALYAFALALSTNRVLILSGKEFKHLYSSKIDFTHDELVKRASRVLNHVDLGTPVKYENRMYAKFEITQSNHNEVHSIYYGTKFSDIDILYTNNLGAHRHLDLIMAHDKNFRRKFLGSFNYREIDFLDQITATTSHNQYMLVPSYPMGWRLIWGCVQWFLFDTLSIDLKRALIQPFEELLTPCEFIVSVHFRGGDTNFKEMTLQDKTRNARDQALIEKWSKRVRTPIEAMSLFISKAKELVKTWDRYNVCIFSSSDSTIFHERVRSVFGEIAIKTSGLPKHSSLSNDESAILKSLADYLLLGIADGIVHGMSGMSESAIERSLGQNEEIKCRSPQKKLWSKIWSWYCITKDKEPDSRANSTIKFLLKKYPEYMKSPLHAKT